MVKNREIKEELLGEALVLEGDHPYEIPGNWIWSDLKAISTYIQRGKSPKYVEQSDVTVVSQKCVQWSGFDISLARCIDESSLKNYKEERYLRKNDILWNSTGTGTIGRLALIEDDLEGINVADSHVTVVRPNNNIVNSKLLFRWLSGPYVQNKLNHLWSGSTNQVELNLMTVKNQLVPIPPYKEQIRIAEKVERLLNKIEEAKQFIEKAKETFELRRAATLDKAFRGELTKDFRKSQRSKTNIELQNNVVKKFKSQLDPKIKENLYVLPEGWKWVEVNELIDNMVYGTSSKTNDDASGTPIIRMGNIQEGEITKVNYKYLPTDHPDVLKLDVQTNDILFNRTNSYELVGKSAIITEEFDGKYSFASYLIRLRLIEKDILAPYIVQFINSHIGREMLLSMVTQQVGQANINSQKLASLMIPLPTIEEIKEINKWLKELNDRERNTIKILDLDSTVNNLKQSILSRAFKGELGTNDPNEESAIELLKSIPEEKL